MPKILSYCSSSLPGKTIFEKVKNAIRVGIAIDLELKIRDIQNKKKLIYSIKEINCPELLHMIVMIRI